VQPLQLAPRKFNLFAFLQQIFIAWVQNYTVSPLTSNHLSIQGCNFM